MFPTALTGFYKIPGQGVLKKAESGFSEIVGSFHIQLKPEPSLYFVNKRLTVTQHGPIIYVYCYRPHDLAILQKGIS
jgi:hypothetical protein